MFSISVNRIKLIATQVVALAMRASQVFALFLDINVSAAPEIAPERPERFPDCRSTAAISNKQEKT
jgi:hypothetical protein